MRVPLMGKLEGARFIDIHYLAKAVIIVGELEGRYGYSLKHEGIPRIILLPNEECTSFEYNGAISFQPSSQFLYNLIQQPLEPIRGPRKKLRPAGPIVHEHEPMNQTIYGSKHYYSRPTAAPRQHGPLQDMYVEMKRMTRWRKFQDRVIMKLVNEVKSLKKAISRGASCASCNSNQNL
ncbi:unnamed protein product [Cochlearia groenlandica]